MFFGGMYVIRFVQIVHRFTDTQAEFTALSISHSAYYRQSPTPVKQTFFQIVCSWSWAFWQCSRHSVGGFFLMAKTKQSISQLQAPQLDMKVVMVCCSIASLRSEVRIGICNMMLHQTNNSQHLKGTGILQNAEHWSPKHALPLFECLGPCVAQRPVPSCDLMVY